MIVKTIYLIRGFIESETTSTSVYADGLIRALQNISESEFKYTKYSPKLLLPNWLRNIWGMRFARYFLFPFQVPNRKNTISHLLDHNYSHFLYTRKPKKTIITVTDLMPVLWWKGLLPVRSKKGMPLTVLYSLYALRRASHIITISSNTKNDLVKFIGCDPSKISVIYLGIDPIFKPYQLELKNTIRAQLFGQEPKIIILITGSQFYKNHETALKTIALLLARGMQNIYLVKTGNPTQEWLNLVEKYELVKNVINIGFIPREQMPDLYNAVDVLLFPSLYEGFGWPPLEAMACGTPAVTSNVASLPEVMGNLDTMCKPFDVIGIVNKIQLLLINEEYRQSIIAQGITQSSKFSWEDTANQTVQIYNLVAGKV